MRISTKGRYGLRALVDLAANSNGEHLPLSSIAKRQDISVNYLEQVFSILRKAGIVFSIKGAQGGYVLSKDPREIIVGEVLRALEGDLSIIDDPELYNEQTKEDLIKSCINTLLWTKINKRVNDIIDNMSIEDLVEEYRKVRGDIPVMYNI